MLNRYAVNLTTFSLCALALAIFISVSLISVYHVLILIAFILLTTDKEFNFKSLPASCWALLTFAAVQLLSATINYNELEEKLRSIGGVKYPLFGVLALLIFRYKKIQTNDFFRKYSLIAFNIFLATIAIAFLNGIKNEEYKTRLGGLTDVMRYGYGTALVLLALLPVILNLKKFPRVNKYYLSITFILGFTGLFLSYTRGAMLGFLIGLPIIFFFFNKRLSILVTSISVVIISFMVVVSLSGGSNYSRFLMASDSSSNTARISQYLSALHAFQEHPVIGLGPQQLRFHVKEIKKKYKLEHPDYAEHAHNVFLEIAANTGILGLLSFLAWLCLWLKELIFSRNNFTKQMFIPAIVFIVIAGQFEMLMMAQTSALIYFLYSISHLPLFKNENELKNYE